MGAFIRLLILGSLFVLTLKSPLLAHKTREKWGTHSLLAIIFFKDEILFSICGAGVGAGDRGYDFRINGHAAGDSRS